MWILFAVGFLNGAVVQYPMERHKTYAECYKVAKVFNVDSTRDRIYVCEKSASNLKNIEG